MLKELKAKERQLKDNISKADTLRELENALAEAMEFTDYIYAIGYTFSEVYNQTDETGREIYFVRPVLNEEMKEIAGILKGEKIDFFHTAYFNTEKFKESGYFQEKSEGVFQCL